MSYLDFLSEEPQLDFFEAPKLRDMPLAEGARYRDYGLRWYQQEAKEAIELELAVNQSTLLVLATGLGKTQVFSAVAGDWEGDVLVLAHRDELVIQAKERLQQMLGEEVDTEQREERSDKHARIVVGSIQSMNQKRLDRLGKDRFSLVIMDECFPAGTLVDGRRIETLRVGDMVSSVDHSTGMMCRRRVSRIFKKPMPSMYRLWYGESSVDCTYNHPVFVKGKGYVEAKNLVRGDLLCVRQRFPVRGGHLDAAEEDVFQGVSSQELCGDYGAHEPETRIGSDEGQQSYGSSGDSSPSLRDALAYWSQAPGAWGEWARAYGRPAAPADRTWPGMGGRAGNSNEAAPWGRLSVALQGGPRSQGTGRGGGSGWPQPLLAGEAAPGQEEGRLLAWTRLDCVESLEPSGAGGDFVYNLEVEGSHTYFANDVLVHNCHHAIARTYRRAFEYFNCKKLGVTATPDRGDEKALGKLFDSVAYVMDIAEGIDSGYLVPIRARSVALQEIDISGVATVAGDLVAAQLDEAMVKAVEGIVTKTLELEPGRQGIGFFPGVRSAELAAVRMNHHKPGSAAWISGKTDPDERRDINRRFKNREIQYLFNCQIATEGFDAPATDLIIQGRPTKSRAFYAQTVGRGTRVLPGIVDHFRGKEDSRIRGEAIRNSAKPDCMVLDFVGNTGKHQLITPEDILGGSYTEAEVKLAKKKRLAGGDPREALEAARAELRKIAAAVKATVRATVSEVFDPFTAFGMNRAAMEESSVRFGWKPLSPAQRDLLVARGMGMEEASQLSKSMATKLIGTIMLRQKKGLATFKQMRELARRGYSVPKNISFRRASELLTERRPS